MRRLSLVQRNTGFDPAHQRAVVLAVGVEQLAARMRNRADRFFDQQTRFGPRQIDAASALFAGCAIVVADGVEAEQRQSKAVLAAGGAVATARVAAGPHEDRHHVQMETDRPVGRRVHDGDRRFGLMALVLGDQLGGAVGHRVQGRVVQPGHALGAQPHHRVAGDVQCHSVVAAGHDQHPLIVPLSAQVDVRRIDVDSSDLGGRKDRRPSHDQARDPSNSRFHLVRLLVSLLLLFL